MAKLMAEFKDVYSAQVIKYGIKTACVNELKRAAF